MAQSGSPATRVAKVGSSHSQEPEARVACEERTRTGMVMMLDGITKKVCVNYEQIIPQVARSAGYDNDDKGLDWRAMKRHCSDRGKNA